MELLVLAKEPVPGRVKTRLCPPCSSEDAAALAEAALADTLCAAVASGASRVVLALDGRPGPWCPAGVVVVPQVRGPLDVRLAAAWSTLGGAAFQIGMDTPQLGAAQLAGAMDAVAAPGVDAVLGPAADGGWWGVGMRCPDPLVFLGVPTSRPDTGARQRRRLRDRGMAVSSLPRVRDVDVWSDALAVAAGAPSTRFADAVRHVVQRHEAAA